MSSKPFEGNLSKAHKAIKRIETELDSPMLNPDIVAANLGLGFLHVFIELTAQIRDYVKNQSK